MRIIGLGARTRELAERHFQFALSSTQTRQRLGGSAAVRRFPPQDMGARMSCYVVSKSCQFAKSIGSASRLVRFEGIVAFRGLDARSEVDSSGGATVTAMATQLQLA